MTLAISRDLYRYPPALWIYPGHSSSWTSAQAFIVTPKLFEPLALGFYFLFWAVHYDKVDGGDWKRPLLLYSKKTADRRVKDQQSQNWDCSSKG